LVETKSGTKQGRILGGKKSGVASARPVIHSSHGKGVPRGGPEGGEAVLVPPIPKKRATRIKVATGSKDAAAKVPRPKIADGPPRHRKGKAAPSASADSLASDSARELAVAIATAALDKKAVGLEVLDVAGKVDYADFLVLMTGRSDRQVQALAQGIEESLRDKGKRPLSVEGLPHASWVLMDFGDVVVHVFQDDARSSYDLDGLWMDARRLPLPVPEELR
jgi:ribosome-associated protein